MAYSVEKDVLPFIGPDNDTDIILFFTDGKNEPRKLNVRRCIEGDVDFTGNALSYEGETLKDFITACPKTPEKAIQFSWIREPDISSNFTDTNGFQFAYQNVYIDGFVSSISSISEVAYPPRIQALGADSLNINSVETACILSIPRQNEEIDAVRILFREGNSGVFKLIEEVSNRVDVGIENFEVSGDEETLGFYTFRNDAIYPVVPTSITRKNFDNLPRKAKAQTVAGNRLMYGNYLEGFDNVATSANVEVLYNDVTQSVQDGLSGGSITSINVLSNGARSNTNDQRGENIGFIIDVGTEDISPGTYRLSVNLAPEKNFHIFSGQTYLSSRNQLFNEVQGFDNTISITDSAGSFAGSNFNTVHAIQPNNGGGYAPVDNEGEQFLYNYHPNIDGPLTMRWKLGLSTLSPVATVDVGTTPSSPLILDGQVVTIDVLLSVNTQVSASEFMSAIDSVLTSGTPNSASVDLISYSGLNTNIAEFGFGPDTAQTLSGAFDVIEIDLGIDNGQKFSHNSSLGDKICQVPLREDFPIENEISQFDTTYTEWSQRVNGAPMGFFIINKATLIMSVDPVSDGAGLGDDTNPLGDQGDPQTSTRRYYRLVAHDLKIEDIVSCVPEPVEGLGWSPTYQDNNQIKLEQDPLIPWGLRVESSGQDSLLENGGTGQFFWPIVKTFGEQTTQTFTGRTVGSVPAFDESFGLGDTISLDYWPSPQIPGATYRFTRADGGNPMRIFTATVTSFHGTASNPKLDVDDSTMVWETDDPPFSGTYSSWWISLVDTSGVETDFTNPNFPQEIGTKKSDGTYVSFSDTRVLPVAINRWTAFRNGYDNTFMRYEIPSTGPQQTVEVFAYDLDTVLPPMSVGWTGRPLVDFCEFNGAAQFPSGRKWSVIDGAGGVGGEIKNPGGFSQEVFISKAMNDLYETPWFGGYEGVPEMNTGAEKPVSNRRGVIWNSSLVGVVENMRFMKPEAKSTDTSASQEELQYITPSTPSAGERNSSPLSDVGSYLDIGLEGEAFSSFKTRDFHDFGVVYFDQRGRAGYVNPLPAAYVPGYSDEERGPDQKGKVAVKYSLLHEPPEWADSYKIVYSGSANTERFIQYSAGGAFTEPDSTVGADGKIYVSLNYLQSNKASYASAYGAQDQDTGEPILYRFTPGDRLRVISYFEDDETIKYVPRDYEFDVLGVEQLSQQQEDNPILPINTSIFGDAAAQNLEIIRRTGSFVVLRNNILADGFAASFVDSGSSKWGDRCIFEIYTPRKSRGDEQIPYYETPFGGRVIETASGKEHEYGQITIDQGDVFFRKVPVNIRPFDEGEFVDLLAAAENGNVAGIVNDASEARFKGYFLESNTVTDLFKSNAKSFGKPHFRVYGATERLNDTSIIFSDKTSQDNFNVFYTPMRLFNQNYFDLPNKYGDIDYIQDFGSDLFFSQNSKVGFLQVERSLTTSAQGQDTINISSDVLSSPRFFPEDVGTDGHPESVTCTNSNAFFVDKSRGMIVSAGTRGMDILSDADMRTFFKKQLSYLGDDCRVVTGFNPRTEELIVSSFVNSITNQTSEGEEYLNDGGPSTYAFDLRSKNWTSAYSFHSGEYSSVGDCFISYKPIPRPFGVDLVWKHNDHENKNNFHGLTARSRMKMVLSNNPNLTKDYKAVSIDGTHSWDLNLSTTKETANIPSAEFKLFEGTFFKDIPRSSLDNSTSRIKALTRGERLRPFDFEAPAVTSNIEIIFANDIDQYHITLSGQQQTSELLFVTGTSSTAARFVGLDGVERTVVPIRITSPNSVEVNVNPKIETEEDALFFNTTVTKSLIVVKSNSISYGDSLRDKYLTIEAVDRNTDINRELYSINIDYVESKLDASR